MRNFFRILFDLIKWFGGLFFLFVSLICLSIFIYIEFGGNWLIAEDEKEKLIKEINSTEPLPELFYEVNKMYFPQSYGKSFWRCQIKCIWSDKCHYSESLMVSRDIFIGLQKKRIVRPLLYKRFAPMAFARLIEKNISLKQCYTYRMRSSYYGEYTRNLDEGSQTHFSKPIVELDEMEVLGLHVILIAPTRYNPRRNPNNYQEKITSLIKAHK